MIPLIVNGPAIEPVALADAKQWLKLETGDDDDMVGALITAARLMVEAQRRRMLITQTWRLVYDCWRNGRLIKIPLAPFQSLTAIRVYDSSGTAQTVSTSLYHLDAAPEAARIIFGAPPPNPGRPHAGIEIDIVVGYGATPQSVPEPLRQAIRVLVTDWYENCGDAGDTRGTKEQADRENAKWKRLCGGQARPQPSDPRIVQPAFRLNGQDGRLDASLFARNNNDGPLSGRFGFAAAAILRCAGCAA